MTRASRTVGETVNDRKAFTSGSELLIIAENVFKLSETNSSQIFPFLGERRSNIKELDTRQVWKT